jgi:hypothetical protein
MAKSPDIKPSVPRPRGTLLDYFADHPLVVISIAGLLCSGLGYFCEFVLLAEFGINAIPFADTGDFLLAGLKRPWLFALTFPITAAIISKILQEFRREPAERNLLGVAAAVALVVLGVAVFIHQQVKKEEADLIRSTQAHNVSVLLKDGGPLPGPASAIISATGSFVFLHQQEEGAERVLILPSVNISTITFAVDSQARR